MENTKKPAAFSRVIHPLLPPLRLVMRLSAMMPMTSSMMAALSTVVPTRVLSRPSSRRVSTVMPTLVAARIQPMNRALSSFSWQYPAPNPSMNSIAPTKPSPMGTSTPASAMSVAARPLRFNSFRSVSRPLVNRIMMTPIWEKVFSTSISSGEGFVSP